MANPFQQQVRLRKVVYTALILVLFTGSLMYRRFVVEPQAENLQLREVSRGEVELTGSAVRLTLTGSRGLAVTMLWKSAMKEQEKHRWNEVELLVGTITKLQPYFITPWLFQGWNLAFNVSVECDRPHDKYYYVSRGLQLLAEGERRNQGSGLDEHGQPRFPGNPDLRHNMGFWYQLKIGHSDEKNAMQCLLEMSCIDPLMRDPKKLLRADREVDLDQFKGFCESYPMLVRRLSEHLDYNTPLQVVAFLKDNQVLPSRFKEGAATLGGKTPLEEDRKQFPALPTPPPQLAFPPYLQHLREVWPDPNARDLNQNEPINVYLFSRTWYTYAQLPLPKPFKDPGAKPPEFDPVRNRLPKHMVIMLFRGYPAHAQRFMAENLREEGWFDEEGWTTPAEWFDSLGGDEEIVIGKHEKYHSRRAWELAYQFYLDQGVQNGLYFTTQERWDLEKQAQLFRKKFPEVRSGEFWKLRPDQDKGEMAKSYFAHQKLAYCDHYLNMTNFNSHLFEADAERDPQAVLAHKLFFYAKRQGESTKALATFEKAIPLWTDLLLRYPDYRNIAASQEEIYEDELKYIRLMQKEKQGLFRPLALGMAQVTSWSAPIGPGFGIPALTVPYGCQKLDANQLASIIPIRTFRGPLDRILVFNVPFFEEDTKRMLLLWSQASLPMPMLVYPGQQQRLLATQATFRDPPPNTFWGRLINNEAVMVVRNRIPGLQGVGLRGLQGPPKVLRPSTK